MDNYRVIILIPALNSESPAKGALALANGICNKSEVILISIKRVPLEELHINKQVKVILLDELSQSWYGKVNALKKIAQQSQNQKKTLSISYCFSADVMNYMIRKSVITMSSIRGNLPENYRIAYGFFGLILASFQLRVVKNFNVVTAMSRSMLSQLKDYKFKNLSLIGNFLDETYLCRFKKDTTVVKRGEVRFIYIGSLVKRKCPLLLVDTVSKLLKNGINCRLDIVGEGLLEEEVVKKIKLLGIQDYVTLHGYITEPFDLLANADCMVLPSVSEGVSRSIMESLYLGVWCVIRDVEAASELITDNVNGTLFKDDNDLFRAMSCVSGSLETIRSIPLESRLPTFFSQQYNCKKFLKLLEDY